MPDHTECLMSDEDREAEQLRHRADYWTEVNNWNGRALRAMYSRHQFKPRRISYRLLWIFWIAVTVAGILAAYEWGVWLP